jgi:hypothetical protein
VFFGRVRHLSRNFYAPNSQVKLFVQNLPHAALFFGVYGENLPDTFIFLPDADVFVVSFLGRMFLFAVFGNNMERGHKDLPESAIYCLSSGTLSPLHQKIVAFGRFLLHASFFSRLRGNFSPVGLRVPSLVAVL